jgi:hypothetical protein
LREAKAPDIEAEFANISLFIIGEYLTTTKPSGNTFHECEKCGVWGSAALLHRIQLVGGEYASTTRTESCVEMSS